MYNSSSIADVIIAITAIFKICYYPQDLLKPELQADDGNEAL